MTTSLDDFRRFQAADAKFRNGDGINDEELNLLLDRYSAASVAMHDLWHPEYYLTTRDIDTKLRTLRLFRDSRNARNK